MKMILVVEDLLNILKELELNFAKLYNNIAHMEGQYDPQVKAIAKVLSLQEYAHANWYENLINSKNSDFNTNVEQIAIDQHCYIKAKDMLNEFRAEIKKRPIMDVKELVDFAIYYEKLNAKVLKNIQAEIGEMLSNDVNNLLLKLIDIEKEHTKMLQQFQH